MNKRLLAAFGNKLSRKNAVIAVILIIIIVAAYIILNRKAEVVEDTPIVSIMPTQQENVEIYGDYVGRIRAQQFVEVRARVDGPSAIWSVSAPCMSRMRQASWTWTMQ